MSERAPSASRWLRDGSGRTSGLREIEFDDQLVIPFIGRDQLQAKGVAVDELEKELARVASNLTTGWAPMRLTGSLATIATSTAADQAIDSLTQLDAVWALLGVPDLDLLDRALAQPLSQWSRRESAEPTESPLRVIARDVLASERVPSVVGVVLGAAGSVRLAATIQLRRQALRNLGAELDRIADSDGPVTEIALLVAARAREAVALGEALVNHLERSSGPDAVRFAARWRELTIAVSSRLSRTLAAVDRLVGMEH